MFETEETFFVCVHLEGLSRSCDRASCKFLIIKPTSCIISQIYSWNETLHVSDSSSDHHQEFFTVRTAMVYVRQFCRQLASRSRMEHPASARKLSAKVSDIYHCCAYSEKLLMMVRGTVRNM